MQDDGLWFAVFLQVVTCAILLFFIVKFASFAEGPGRRFVHLGPSSEAVPINVCGISVDSWPKWFLLVGMLVALECVNTYTFKTYKTWYRHGVLTGNMMNIDGDEGNPAHDPSSYLLAITLWRFSTFIPSTFKWLATISTQQLQFLVPSLLVRTAVSNYMDYKKLTSSS